MAIESQPQTVLGHAECLVRGKDPVLKEGPFPAERSRQIPWRRRLSKTSEPDPGVRANPAGESV